MTQDETCTLLTVKKHQLCYEAFTIVSLKLT